MRAFAVLACMVLFVRSVVAVMAQDLGGAI